MIRRSNNELNILSTAAVALVAGLYKSELIGGFRTKALPAENSLYPLVMLQFLSQWQRSLNRWVSGLWGLRER